MECKICQLTKELTTCDKCMSNMQTTMLNKLLEAVPNEMTTQKMLKDIQEELKSLREVLQEAKIANLNLKATKLEQEILF